jgi:hypothetical protein
MGNLACNKKKKYLNYLLNKIKKLNLIYFKKNDFKFIIYYIYNIDKLEKENLTEKVEIYKKMSSEYKANYEKLKVNIINIFLKK